MNINRYVLCKERSLQKIISKQPKPNTTAIGVCSETQVTHHIITKRSDECLPISAYVPKHKEGDGKKFPVIIDIYGGDFVAGRSALNRNFGAWCAEHGYLTFLPEFFFKISIISFTASALHPNLKTLWSSWKTLSFPTTNRSSMWLQAVWKLWGFQSRRVISTRMTSPPSMFPSNLSAFITSF